MKYMQFIKGAILCSLTLIGTLSAQAKKTTAIIDQLKAVNLADIITNPQQQLALGQGMIAAMAEIKKVAFPDTKKVLAELALTKICYGAVMYMITTKAAEIINDGFTSDKIMNSVKDTFNVDAIKTAADIKDVAVNAKNLTCKYCNDIDAEINLAAAVDEVAKIMGNAKNLINGVTALAQQHAGNSSEKVLGLTVVLEDGTEQSLRTYIPTLIEKCKTALEDNWNTKLTVATKLIDVQNTEVKKTSFFDSIRGAITRTLGIA